MKHIIIKGCLLGLTAGAIASFFDAFYMLRQDTYVPLEYPLLLLSINFLFWSFCGFMVALGSSWVFSRKKNQGNTEDLFGLIVFLPFFSITYGLLGVFNHNEIFSQALYIKVIFLSICSWCVFYVLRKRKGFGNQAVPGLLIPELLTIVVLFHACLNISDASWSHSLFKTFYSIDPVAATHVYFEKFNVYSTALGGVFLLAVLGFYVFVLARFKVSGLGANAAVASLVAVALCCVSLCFLLNRAAFLKKYELVTEPHLSASSEVLPPVILIVMDTVRKRSLDEHPDVFENLEAFSRNSLVFEFCIADSSWTLPSHASLFTGFSPSEHGVHHMLDSEPWFGAWPPARPLHDDFATLAEVFASAGYDTAAVVSNFAVLNTGCGLHQGFSVYDASKSIGYMYEALTFRPLIHSMSILTNIKNKFALPYRKAEDVNNAVELLSQRLAGRPFFLFINFMDAHGPYMPEHRFKRKFFDFFDLRGHVFLCRLANFFGWTDGASRCDIDEMLYKAEIAYLDHHIGLLFERLMEAGLYDDALIVVTSDHGELFCKNGFSGHRTPLYEGVTRVPLLIKFPGQKVVGVEKHCITLADLYPTILTICGLPYHNEISGLPFAKPVRPVVSAFRSYEIGRHRVLYDGRYKYMKFERGKKNALYNIEGDPLENDNLLDAVSEKTEDMDTLLAEWLRQHCPKYPASALDLEGADDIRHRNDLRALGYIQ